MNMTGRKRSRQLNNSGSTLVTTMVAMLFLIVLGTIILGVSAANFETKASDRQSKLDFYENEQALDDIYNGIGQVASRCMGAAYTTVLNQVSSGTYSSQDEAYEAFCKEFVKNLKNDYNVNNPTEVQAQLNVYALASAAVIVQDLEGIEISYVDDTLPEADLVPTAFTFKNVEVLYQNQNAETFESVITTDIVINMPYITFFDANDEVFDYCLAANKGIYFTNANRIIEGSVYAGTSSASAVGYEVEGDVKGGINLYGSSVTFMSKYLVTKGDINVRRSTLVVSNGGLDHSNIWAESIRTSGGGDAAEHAVINISGRTFVANDLELNSFASAVILQGAYYGYNNGVYATVETDEIGGDLFHTKSSAIIVNQRQASIDLSGLNTLVLAGKAYMDFLNAEQATGESVALKSNQIMYMVPDEFLSFANPLSEAERVTLGIDVNAAVTIPNTWYYYSYLSPVAPVQVKSYTVSGQTFYYFYLNFIENKAEQYAEEILSAEAPADASDTMAVWRWNMKQRLAARLFNSVAGSAFVNNITVNGSEDLSVFGQGAIVSADELNGFRVLADSSDWDTSQVTTMSRVFNYRYQWLYDYFDSKEELALRDDHMLAPSTLGYAEDLLPLDSIIDFSRLDAKLTDNEFTDYTCGYRTLISNSDITIDTDYTGIILCGGNVTVNAGCDVEGLVMAKGNILVNGDGNIAANRSIVQTLLDEEIRRENAKTAAEEENREFVIYYLRNYSGDHTGTTANNTNTGTDYTDYINYANWTKGDVD